MNRIQLTSRTVAVLNALTAAGTGWHRASSIATDCGLSLHSTSARLWWLRRVRIDSYRSGRWSLLALDLFARQPK